MRFDFLVLSLFLITYVKKLIWLRPLTGTRQMFLTVFEGQIDECRGMRNLRMDITWRFDWEWSEQKFLAISNVKCQDEKFPVSRKFTRLKIQDYFFKFQIFLDRYANSKLFPNFPDCSRGPFFRTCDNNFRGGIFWANSKEECS